MVINEVSLDVIDVYLDVIELKFVASGEARKDFMVTMIYFSNLLINRFNGMNLPISMRNTNVQKPLTMWKPFILLELNGLQRGSTLVKHTHVELT
jgi:hypothetical protein